jgi:hypothetical protein
MAHYRASWRARSAFPKSESCRALQVLDCFGATRVAMTSGDRRRPSLRARAQRGRIQGSQAN